MIINDFFKKIICINLNRREDRWIEIQKQFTKFDIIDVERLSACDGQLLEVDLYKEHKGELGSAISHLNAIKRAKELNCENVLIFEDDLVIKDEFYNYFETIINQLPNNWNILMFGGNNQGQLQYINNNINRTSRTFALQMYAVNSKCYDYLINMLENEIKIALTYNKNTKFVSLAGDYFIANHMPYLNVYITNPKLSYQVDDDFSDIQHTKVNYPFLKN